MSARATVASVALVWLALELVKEFKCYVKTKILSYATTLRPTSFSIMVTAALASCTSSSTASSPFHSSSFASSQARSLAAASSMFLASST